MPVRVRVSAWSVEDAKLWPHLHPYGTGSLYSELGSGGMYRLVHNRLLLIQSGFRSNNLYAFWFLNRCIAKEWLIFCTHALRRIVRSMPSSPCTRPRLWSLRIRNFSAWKESGECKDAGPRTNKAPMHSRVHLARLYRTLFPKALRGVLACRHVCEFSAP